MPPFLEEQYQVYYHGFIVYICGVDVTPYVMGSLAISYTDKASWNTSSIELSNAQDIFVLTPANIEDQDNSKGTWRLPTWEDYSEEAKFKMLQYKSSPGRNPKSPKTGEFLVWPLNPFSAIIHKHDPVRVFLHDPTTADFDRWLYGFTGYVEKVSYTDDYITSGGTLSISCYDIRALMQKMRVQTNPLLQKGTTALNPEKLEVFYKEGFFKDLRSGSVQSHNYANKSFENVFEELTSGTMNEGKLKRAKNAGVGRLAFKQRVRYPDKGGSSDKNTKILEDWHKLVVFGSTNTYLTMAEVIRIGEGSVWDGPYSPDTQGVYQLLPLTGTGADTLVQSSVGEVSTSFEWQTRYDLLNDFAQRIDYQWFVTPAGDVVMEFPMYDFDPDDFGEFQDVFILNHHLISTSGSDEDSDIVTGILAEGGHPHAKIDQATSQTAHDNSYKTAAYAIHLSQRFGVNVDQISFPFVPDVGKLRALAIVELQKRLSTAASVSVDFAFRPFLSVNRPLNNKVNGRMGITNTVGFTMNLFQDVSINASLNYVRYLGRDGKHKSISGGESMPLNYKGLFGRGKPDLNVLLDKSFVRLT